MGAIRIYKRFYDININNVSETTYNPITPVYLNASSFARNTTNVIEGNLTPLLESPGIYYVDLNSALYDGDSQYDLQWNVIYLPSAPIKTLLTTFAVKSVYNTIAEKIDIFMDTQDTIEITNNYPTIEIEIK